MQKKLVSELKTFGENMPGGFFVYKAGGSEEVIYANSYVISLFGCEDAEDFKKHTGNTFRGIVYPEDYILVNHSIDIQVRTEKISYDHVVYRIKRKDGEIRWINDYGRLVELEGVGMVFFVFVSDETELHDDDRLVNYDHQLLQAMDAIHLALGSGDWSMNFDENAKMTACSWSHRFREMLDYDSVEDFPDELESWSDLLHEEDKERVLNHYWDVVKDYSGKKTYDIYYRLYTKKRGVRWFRAIGRLVRREDGSPVSFYGIFLDVEEEMQNRLNESKRNSAILEAVSREYHSMWLVSKADLTMHFIRSNGVSTNQKALDMFRANANVDIAINRYIDTYVVEEERERVRGASDSSVVMHEIEHQPVYSVNYRRIDDNGNITYHQVAFADAGEGFILAFHDIDSTVREEQEKQKILEDALKAAESANKAKTVFLNNMSHDIRTPMNAIIGFTALAGSHLDDKEVLQDYLKKITVSSNHLLSLINDVLDMSRIESGRVKIEEKPCHLPTIMHDLRNILQADINSKRLNFLVDIIDVVDEDIICDRLRLNQVLLNCMSNAVKYTKPGGTVGIRVEEKVSDKAGYADFEFTVHDTGIGMSAEFASHIFEPFTREETSTVNGIQGTGLGMAITKNIIDMMGGSISVDTKLGEGTSFKICLSFKLASEHQPIRTIGSLAGMRALVVDDNMDSCVNVSRMLFAIGMSAEWTTSGAEAVYKAKYAYEDGKSYRAFIIDWLMPDMNGVEVVRRIRQNVGEDIPIIILTAYDWTDIEKDAREAGVTAFCAKPIFFSELYDVLNGCVHEEEESLENEKIIAESEDPDVSEKENREEKQNYHSSRILLVEDNDLNREIAAEMLSDYGPIIEEAENGRVALEMMKTSPEGYYSLILMDIQMPVMDGYTATKEIRGLDRKDAKDVPIVAVSANAFEEDRRMSIECGMNDHITKPFNQAKLAEMLKVYLG